MTKILRKSLKSHKTQFQLFKRCYWRKFDITSLLADIQNVADSIQIRV